MSDAPGMYGDRAEFYDPIYHWKDYDAEATRLVELLDAADIGEWSRVLDAACGTGEHIRRLRDRYDMSGLDLSEGIGDRRGRSAGAFGGRRADGLRA